MRVPLSWLREYAAVPAAEPAREIATRLIRAGLEVERVEPVGHDVTGVVVGEVVDFVEEQHSNGKTVRWCQVRVADGAEPRGIVCGARNFAAGDRVPVALPGAVLPGAFQITARKTYGHVSDGMICSSRELGVGEDHSGILVLEGAPPLGADVVALLDLRDDVLDIAVTPDRGYCLSVRGVAREAATAYAVPFRDPGRVDGLPAPGPDPAWPVRVEDPDGCDRYVARRVTGIDPSRPSPQWLQRRLLLAGMRPISLAVDVTNHVLLDLGQPLHAFDAAALRGPVVVRRARAGERITTLDGQERALEPGDLLITDDTGPIALAGVMGGRSSEVGPGTTDVVIEAAHFDPATIARTSRRLRLSSEASRRFERGVDPDLAAAAAEAAVRLLVELGGGTAEPTVTDVDHRRPAAAIRLPLGEAGRLAGRDYAEEVVRGRLADVGCGLTGTDPLEVTPPSWRPDLSMAADLVEEIARLEGYDTVPSALPSLPPGRGLTRSQRARRSVGRGLAGAGYVEVLCYPFVGDPVLDAMGVPAGDDRRRTVVLANPLSDEEPALRTTLLPGLLAALTRNLGRGQPDLALFELGQVFLAPAPGAAPAGPVPVPGVDARPSAEQLAALEAALPLQPRHVAAVLCGEREPAGWWGPGRPAAWSDAVEAARIVARSAGAALEIRAGDLAPWHPGRCAELRTAAGVVVGHAGELHPRVVAALELPARTCAMELDLDAVIAAGVEVVPAPAVSPFPVATQDVALVVADEVPAGHVEEALRAGAGGLLESLRLFDVYAGEQIGAGRKSLAYALRFRAPDRTLTVEETTVARDAAVAEAERRCGAVRRG